jgi:hypothetical protein
MADGAGGAPAVRAGGGKAVSASSPLTAHTKGKRFFFLRAV